MTLHRLCRSGNREDGRMSRRGSTSLQIGAKDHRTSSERGSNSSIAHRLSLGSSSSSSASAAERSSQALDYFHQSS